MSDVNDSPLTFLCPACETELEAKPKAAGRVIDCPSCGEQMRVPTREELAAASTPEPESSRFPSASGTVHRRPSAVRKSPPGRKRRKKRRGEHLAGWITFLLLAAAAGGGGYWVWSRQSSPGADPASAESDAAPRERFKRPGESASLRAAGRTVPAAVTPVAAADEAPPPPAKNWELTGRAEVETFQFGTGGDGDEEITDVVARGDGRLVMVGVLASDAPLPDAKTVHRLVDERPGDTHAFVAEFSPDGQTCEWFGLFGGDLLEPDCLALGPDGSIAVGGRIRDRMKSVAGPEAGDFGGRSAVVLKVAADGSRVEWIRAGGPNQAVVEDVVVDDLGRVLFTGGTMGRGHAAYILRKNADGSDSGFPGQPDGREWAIDFDVRGGQFVEEGQVGAFYQLDDKHGGSYDYDGPGGWGPAYYILHGIRQGGHLALMPNGDIVAAGTLQYDFRVKGKKKYPAFDTIVARWSPDGDLIWSSNLYQEGDSVHTPDQKDRGLVYNPVNGDLYVLVGQHGSNEYRLKGKLVGDTGNLFISWIGRVDADTGTILEGW